MARWFRWFWISAQSSQSSSFFFLFSRILPDRLGRRTHQRKYVLLSLLLQNSSQSYMVFLDRRVCFLEMLSHPPAATEEQAVLWWQSDSKGRYGFFPPAEHLNFTF
ncbi:hypothetical protein AMECASPLE_028693 [Ameca splendens]|uniref:Secreted protein n=1 Tax=Ameca splendens TaxID=208324 RepID=A0ABV0XIL9_9TELE